jgi:hypothetical protein
VVGRHDRVRRQAAGQQLEHQAHPRALGPADRRRDGGQRRVVAVFREGKVAAELSGDLSADDIIHATFEGPGFTAGQAYGEATAKGVAP